MNMEEIKARKLEAAQADLALLREGLALIGATDIPAVEQRLMEIAAHADDPAIFTVCTQHLTCLRAVKSVFDVSIDRYEKTITAMQPPPAPKPATPAVPAPEPPPAA